MEDSIKAIGFFVLLAVTCLILSLVLDSLIGISWQKMTYHDFFVEKQILITMGMIAGIIFRHFFKKN